MSFIKPLCLGFLAFVAQCAMGAVTVTVQPAELFFQPGGSFTFTAQATATANETIVGYSWLISTNALPPYIPIPGASSGTLTINNVQLANAGHYAVLVTYNTATASGLTVQSAPALLAPVVPPVITSATNATIQQGMPFSYAITAIGSPPILFGASGLPAGFSIDPVSGVISGESAILGVYSITLLASNVVTAETNLTLTVASSAPVIISPLTAFGQQGQLFTATIVATNNPLSFSANGLPPGLNLNPSTGVISGASLLSGAFPVTITAANQWGVDTETLTLDLASAVPIITSVLIANGVENQTNFSYTISAVNSPTSFAAAGLPAGLLLNTNTGVISGSLFIGGTNNIVIFAANAYGVGSNVLSLVVAYAALPGLAIVDVTNFYSAPYLLDFTFSLRDNPEAVLDPSLGNAVVRPPEELQVQCYEGDLQDSNAVAIPSETSFIVNRAVDSKIFKTFFALDYTASMFTTPDAITDMQAAVENLIDEQPPSAQFGVVEFSADYIAPQIVTGFTSDKGLLTADIDGIQTNFVKGNYAGTRLYDAVATALTNFNATNIDVENFIIVMSDGYDDSSILSVSTNFPTPVDVLVDEAAKDNVKIYCVGFGPNPNIDVLQPLAGRTGGRYYSAATPDDVAAQFALLLKDLDSEYLLRWATLQRSSIGFQPMFTVTVDDQTAGFNTEFILVANPPIVDTNTMPPTTNITYTNVSLVPFYVPSAWAGDVRRGALSLSADAVTNISSVTLSATYVPRYTRELRLHYRANYSCVPSLLETGPGEILNGWSLGQTNDGGGGQWLTLQSPDTNNVLTSLPYGVMSGLVDFQFRYQAVPQGQSAFSFITVDTNIYAHMPPSPEGFALSNASLFTVNYAPLPPFGTPVPWLQSFGFTDTNDLAALELTSPNHTGLALYQDYIAGLNPLDPNATFLAQIAGPESGQPPFISFDSVLGRTYRVDASTELGDWTPLMDNIVGTGGAITIPDARNLTGVSAVFYRVTVRY